MVFWTVCCFFCSSSKSLLGAERTPFLIIAGRWMREHLAVIQMGIIVIISKKVSPKDQMSDEPFSPHTSTSYPISCRMISGARY